MESERHQAPGLPDLGPLDDRFGWKPSAELVALVHERAGSLRRRHRRRVAVTSLALIAVVGSGTGLVLAGDDHRPQDRLVPATPVVDRVGASGSVVALPGRPVRFCAPVAAAAVLYPNAPATPASCDYGVDVAGVDLARLSSRREIDGAVTGTAKLVGAYRNGVLEVELQGPPDFNTAPRPDETAPCPTPAGGWQTRQVNPGVEALLAYEGQHPGEVDYFGLLRTNPGQAVPGPAVLVVLTTGEPARLRAGLSAAYPADMLCVAKSRVTTAQVNDARNDPALQLSPASGIWGNGITSDPQGQPQASVDITVITPAIQAALRRHPGVVQPRPWLTPQ